MKISIAELAEKIGGKLEGDGSVVVSGLAGLKEAVSGDVSFLSNPRYAPLVAETKASVVIVADVWKGTCPCAMIRVKNPDKAFARLAELVAPPPVIVAPGIHPTAVIARDAQLGASVSIGAHCVVEPGAKIGDRTILFAGCYVGHGAVIGSDCKFYPHVTMREYIRIGNRVIIHNGAVIGSDGFGYVREGEEWKKIPQIGIVEIGDDVEIGANVTIDRARFGKTLIESGAKIDNLVQIAHNVRVGRNVAMAAQVGISGSTVICKNAQLGGQAGLAGHLVVGENSVVGAQAGVTKDVPGNSFVSGYPAMPHSEAKRIHAHTMMLPDFRAKIKALEKKVAELENKLVQDK